MKNYHELFNREKNDNALRFRNLVLNNYLDNVLDMDVFKGHTKTDLTLGLQY